MWWYFFASVFGWIFVVLVLGGLLTLVACWCCGVSVDSLFAISDGNATLTCFHCGQETKANGKTCEHCGGELQ